VNFTKDDISIDFSIGGLKALDGLFMEVTFYFEFTEISTGEKTTGVGESFIHPELNLAVGSTDADQLLNAAIMFHGGEEWLNRLANEKKHWFECEDTERRMVDIDPDSIIDPKTYRPEEEIEEEMTCSERLESMLGMSIMELKDALDI
jgi:hypothetical protein